MSVSAAIILDCIHEIDKYDINKLIYIIFET